MSCTYAYENYECFIVFDQVVAVAIDLGWAKVSFLLGDRGRGILPVRACVVRSPGSIFGYWPMCIEKAEDRGRSTSIS